MKFVYEPLFGNNSEKPIINVGIRVVQKSVVGVFNEVPGTGQDLAGQYVPMDGYLQRQEEEREQGGFGLEQALEEEPESLDRNLEFLSKEQKSIETEQDLLGREQEQIDQDREFLGEYQQHLIDFFKPNMP